MEKIYVGNAKTVETKYGKMLKLSFSRKDLEEMHSKLNYKGWVNLNVCKRKEHSKYGHTHSISIDEYVPNTKQPTQPQRTDVDPLDMAVDYPDVPPPQFAPKKQFINSQEPQSDDQDIPF